MSNNIIYMVLITLASIFQRSKSHWNNLPLLPDENRALNYLKQHPVYQYSLPLNYSSRDNKNSNLIPSDTKKVPQNLWIAVTFANNTIPPHLLQLFKRNSHWNIYISDNNLKDLFMNEVFYNTSLLWAYNLINPTAGAAKADMWRYAVLWLYGGVYIDDDSDIATPLDDVITQNDTLIIAYEKNGFNANRCYIPRHHLSEFSYFRNKTNKDIHLFNDHIILNWAIISAPKHPIIIHTISNIIEIIKHEFIQDSVLRTLFFDFRWSIIMCTTGPSVLTASARELIVKYANTSN
eukprot:gene13504-18118_t